MIDVAGPRPHRPETHAYLAAGTCSSGIDGYRHTLVAGQET